MRDGRVQDCLRCQRFVRKIYEEGENEHESRDKGLALRADEEGFILARRKEDEIHHAKDDGAAGRRAVRGAKQLVESRRTEADETERQHHRVPDIPTGDNRQRQPDQARKEKPMLVMLAAKFREGQRAAIIGGELRPDCVPLVPERHRHPVRPYHIERADGREGPERENEHFRQTLLVHGQDHWNFVRSKQQKVKARG